MIGFMRKRGQSPRGLPALFLSCDTVTLPGHYTAYVKRFTKIRATLNCARTTCFAVLLVLWVMSSLSTFEALDMKKRSAARSVRRQNTLIRAEVAGSSAETGRQVGVPTQIDFSASANDRVKASALMNGLQDLKALQQKSIMTRLGRIVERLREVILGTKEELKSLKGVSIIVLDMPPPRDASLKEVDNAGVLENGLGGGAGPGRKCHACELTKESGRKKREADVVDVSDPEVTEDMLQAMTPQEREAFDRKQISTFEAEENVLKGRLTQLMAMEKKEAEFRRSAKSQKKGEDLSEKATETKKGKTRQAMESAEEEESEE